MRVIIEMEVVCSKQGSGNGDVGSRGHGDEAKHKGKSGGMKDNSGSELGWVRCQCQHKRQTEEMSKARKDGVMRKRMKASRTGHRPRHKSSERKAHGSRILRFSRGKLRAGYLKS